MSDRCANASLSPRMRASQITLRNQPWGAMPTSSWACAEPQDHAYEDVGMPPGNRAFAPDSPGKLGGLRAARLVRTIAGLAAVLLVVCGARASDERPPRAEDQGASSAPTPVGPEASTVLVNRPAERGPMAAIPILDRPDAARTA